MYTVWISTNETELYNDTVDVGKNYYLFEGLEPLTEYNVTVVTVNSVGIGWSEMILGSTLGRVTNIT